MNADEGVTDELLEPQVTYWARPPAPKGEMLSWSAYCAENGRPDVWTADDRAAANSGV
jgi:hypothetical protein